MATRSTKPASSSKTPPATVKKRKPGPGRPKSDTRRRTMTVSLDVWAIEWIGANLPRSVSVSAFAREAMQNEILRLQTASSHK